MTDGGGTKLSSRLARVELRDEENAAYTQLHAFLSQYEADTQGQLPPERELCEILGVSRGALRKALARAEAQGRIWRHVGKGTVFGSRPVEDQSDRSGISNHASPPEVLRARSLLEPALAREAALHASVLDLEELERSAVNSRKADSWRRYETWDNRFHRAVATATQNRVLLLLFDNLNNVRRAMAWGRRRPDSPQPPPDHHSFEEHARIVAAIHDRDPDAAEKAMHEHIASVSRMLLRSIR
jgi:DNA-binding FadR family transcriptional regulator